MATPTNTANTHRARFLESLERCAKSKDFMPTFYDYFLSSSEDIRNKFRHTDFDRQQKMLLSSLRLASEAALGNPEGLKELRERGETHNRQHHNIEPGFYDLWLSSLIKAARKYDELWDNEIEIAWGIVLGHFIRHMIRYY